MGALRLEEDANALDLRPPPRRAKSVRRTSSIDVILPKGIGGPTDLRGAARDIFTEVAGAEPKVLREASLSADTTFERKITQFESHPILPNADHLIGKDSLIRMRKSLLEAGADSLSGHAIAHLLDDLVPCSLIQGWLWFKWAEDRDELHRRMTYQEDRVNICAGYVPAAPQFRSKDFLDQASLVEKLEETDDPYALHPLMGMHGPHLRRLRRYDLWLEDDANHKDTVVRIDAMWEDAANAPGEHRVAVHQYRINATMSRDGSRLLAIKATPGVLPNSFCRAAPDNLSLVLDIPVDELWQGILYHMRGPVGCTHLNDAMRGLAQLQPLIDHLNSHG